MIIDVHGYLVPPDLLAHDPQGAWALPRLRLIRMALALCSIPTA